MKRSIIAALISSAWMSSAADPATHTAEARKITAEFFAELKGALVNGMQSGGPVTAVSICQSLAPTIAAKHSEATGWDVARTSLKPRNPDNAPDAWEQKVLLDFEERRAAGESPATLSHFETVEQGGDQYFRFMKGIVMPPAEKMPCLQCHGERLAPGVAAEIDRHYPDDKARGYTAGQVRGAFTLQKKL